MKVVNKKILNASPLEWGGIKFKSRLEVTVYKTLLDNGIKASYEPNKYTIWNGYRPNRVSFYTKGKDGLLALNNKKIISITYTPDFVFDLGLYRIFIEVKGIENDVFYIKKKMFRKYLETMTDCIPIYFEIFTKRQLLEAIKLITFLNTTQMGKLQNIRNLLQYLVIEGDEKLCLTYLEQRKFVPLKEIVDANVYKAEKTMPLLTSPEKMTSSYEKELEHFNKLKTLQGIVDDIAKDFIDPLLDE